MSNSEYVIWCRYGGTEKWLTDQFPGYEDLEELRENLAQEKAIDDKLGESWEYKIMLATYTEVDD